MKGFKDDSGKFRPTENKNGIRMSRDKSIKPNVGVRLQRIEKSFTVQEGIEIAEEQIQRLAGGFREPDTSDKRIGFVRDATKLVNESVKKARTGYDIARGRDIDLIWMKYEYGVPMKRATKLYDAISGR